MPVTDEIKCDAETPQLVMLIPVMDGYNSQFLIGAGTDI
jgi:hypothetical protein